MPADSWGTGGAIFEGLDSRQIGALSKGSCFLHLNDGNTIFESGDPAFGLFVVVEGEVAIVGHAKPGEKLLASLGPGSVFGEIGLIADEGRRTAAARAIGNTKLVAIPGDPDEILGQIGDRQASLQLLQNLVGLLSERLRNASNAAPGSGTRPMLINELRGQPAEGVLRLLESTLGTSRILARLKPGNRLRAGEYLFRQGDPSDGFYLVHSGELEVIDEKDADTPRVLSQVHAPNTIGEAGFFANRVRSASCRTVRPATYTHFSGDDYERLRKTDPRKAFEAMFSAAQLIVRLIVEREKALYLSH